MREIPVTTLADALLRGIEQASFELGERERSALAAALEKEQSQTGRAILAELLENVEVAREERRPLCQDTGVAVVFLDVGQEVRLTGGDVTAAVQGAVAEGYRRFYLRKSMVAHPLARKNTGDNTPAIVHMRLTPGDRVRLRFAAKGGGCENMSRLAMLTPSAGREGVVEFVVRAAREAGGNPCPPVVVGVGLGGNFETCALLAKEALLRPLGEAAANPVDAELERELLDRINATGVGPMGLGGSVTALAVHVASHACHIAALPVAVNLDCHSHRHFETTL
ncbi:MAG TPA: fumarate hydratase [Candidatus Brocadiia bacterium]|nr:fumarate hydratase [Candidatus Brocadiia bacterium]